MAGLLAWWGIFIPKQDSFQVMTAGGCAIARLSDAKMLFNGASITFLVQLTLLALSPIGHLLLGGFDASLCGS
ncbi:MULTISPECIES: hypothetical protein [unclassified Brenneria]|uniref:hypothetical protein n=1 Tax=unclassified Brenneria TaxID=2634434 RepID=UPI0029C423C9|nr:MULTISPECIES: hypothetical protein [unclassified Brenneria]MDX5631108.1 hypothetical protein [Brenneria sp. L3-3Z]MDX5698184.1 hypothetical protein [Brenneria sp. L4-2C]MEE3664920.1 hypothetical protein [Brenneria sp. g21c3]